MQKNMVIHSFRSLIAAPVCAAFLTLCSVTCDDDSSALIPAETSDLVANYANIVEASYGDSVTAAIALRTAIDDFLAAPSQAGLDAARAAWLNARVPYLQTEVYRFYDGPIDDPVDGPEGMINAWPLDELYIDYVSGAPDAGIINNPLEVISEERLMALNEQGGEANIATGFHAIEFLLWGQDENPTGPGQRPYTDYVTDGTGTAAHQQRRQDYLRITAKLLVDHLTAVHREWLPEPTALTRDPYRPAFEAGVPGVAFSKIMTGMLMLTGFETGGERIQTALDSGQQEDEHSCFSDNTHVDMQEDVHGVANVWRGSYQRIDGTQVVGVGVRDIVDQSDPGLAAEIDARVQRCIDLAAQLRGPQNENFDQLIALGNVAGRQRVQALADELRALEASFTAVFELFGLIVPAAE